MEHTTQPLYPHYETLWNSTLPAVQRGALQYDPYLPDKTNDARRGVTLIARLDATVAAAIQRMLRELAAQEPEQYYYPCSDLHITILSLFSANPNYREQLVHLPAYREAIAAALRSIPAIMLDSIGITLSPSAVMVQGFPHDDTLNRLRDTLRSELAARSLADTLDQRYRLVAAHSTVVRYTAPLRQPRKFAAALQRYRHTRFGTSTIGSLTLVLNDWYMSSDTLVELEHFQLGAELAG
jgi:2'-5' RNA ligase